VTESGTGAAALFRTVGLLPDGPAVLGRTTRATGPGVYAVELALPRPTAPIELTRIGKWLERVPGLRMDGQRPTTRALAARLASFWLPSRTVIYLGSTNGSIAARLSALQAHVLGEPRPHAAAQWLRALDVTGLRAWWAATDAPEEYEDALLEAFAATVTAADLTGLPDRTVILPFANLRTPTGTRKAHGITGAVLPLPATPAHPQTTVVTLPAGDADGARVESHGTGTVRRAPRSPRPAARAAGTASSRAAAPAASTELTAEGLARLRAELDELIRVRRPEVVARIRSAKELGDLKENADYTAAREEQSFLEGRIQAIEARLRTAVVAETAVGSARVVLGSRVRVERATPPADDAGPDGMDGSEVAELTIVGASESDPGTGRISSASPVGRALLGRTVGEEVVVATPNGPLRYRVLTLD
jgi:transcription elongation factor GreA